MRGGVYRVPAARQAGLQIPNHSSPLPPSSRQVNWGVPNEIDLIAASFVRKGIDLDLIRDVLGEKGR